MITFLLFRENYIAILQAILVFPVPAGPSIIIRFDFPLALIASYCFLHLRSIWGLKCKTYCDMASFLRSSYPLSINLRKFSLGR